MSQPLRVINSETGEIERTTCAGCNDLLAQLNATLTDRDLAEKEIRRQRVQINALKKDRERERETYAARARVEKLFADWQRIVGKKNSKMGPARFDALKKMVELGYTDEQFELAFYGAKHNPFVKDGKRFQDLELICRNEAKFEDFANRGAAAVRALGQEMGATDA
jgi:hypothetical protein